MKHLFFIVSALFAGCLSAEDVIWSGEKIIDSPLQLVRQNLTLTSGCRIIFKGNGSLSIKHGNFSADTASFLSDEVLDGSFRIHLQNGEVVLKNCSFTGLKTKSPAPYMDGFILIRQSRKVYLQNNTFKNCSAATLAMCNDAAVENNDFSNADEGILLFHVSDSRIIGNSFDSAKNYGIKLNEANRNLIRKNRFSDCQLGVLMFRKSEGNQLIGNSFFGGGIGIKLWGMGGNNLFSGNLFENVRTGIGANFSYEIGKNNRFSNNVVISANLAFSLPKQMEGNAVELFNNAIVSCNHAIHSDGGAVKAQNNLLWQVKTRTMPDNGAVIDLTNTIDSDPKFRDIENGDYRPSGDSPLLRNGINGKNIGIFQGSSAD